MEETEKSILEILRSPKINLFNINISIFDLSGTLLISYIIAKKLDLNIPLVMASSIPIGYLTHEYFNIKTPLNNKINEDLPMASASLYNINQNSK